MENIRYNVIKKVTYRRAREVYELCTGVTLSNKNIRISDGDGNTPKTILATFSAKMDALNELKKYQPIFWKDRDEKGDKYFVEEFFIETERLDEKGELLSDPEFELIDEFHYDVEHHCLAIKRIF